MIQQQENRTKNNLLVLMGLVLSLPRTFQPSSRDRSGGEGKQQSQILSRVQAAGIGAVPLAGAPHPQPALRCVPPPAAK